MKAILILMLTAGTLLGTEFTDKLQAQVYQMKSSTLEKAKVDFSKKKLFVVYYSHEACSSCVKWTKKLNEWYAAESKKYGNVQLIFATRGDETRVALTRYIAKSKIQYPVLDQVHYVNADIKETSAHPFYMDADMGVPRLRFFDADGNEKSVSKMVDSIYKMESVFPKLKELIGKLLKK